MLYSERGRQLLRAEPNEVHWDHHRDAARLLPEAALERDADVWMHSTGDRRAERV